MPSGTYGLLYETIWDSSVSQDWRGVVTFMALLSMADAEDNVYTDPERISRKTGIPMDVIMPGLEFLLREDPYSKSKEAQGRRITFLPLAVDGFEPSLDGYCRGFHITNRALYRRLLRKRYNRSYQAKRRALAKNPSQAHISGNHDSDEAKAALEDFRK